MLKHVRSIVSALARRFRSRAVLELENLALRHQLHVFRRQRPTRPRLSTVDRLLWVWLYRLWPRCLDTIVLVKPATVVQWHRQGFRLFWRWRSRSGRPSAAAMKTTTLAYVPRALRCAMSVHDGRGTKPSLRSRFHLNTDAKSAPGALVNQSGRTDQSVAPMKMQAVFTRRIQGLDLSCMRAHLQNSEGRGPGMKGQTAPRAAELTVGLIRALIYLTQWPSFAILKAWTRRTLYRMRFSTSPILIAVSH